MPAPTFLDLAASIDRTLHRNTQSPDQTFTVGTYAVTALMRTLFGNATGGAVGFTLPTAVGITGMRFTFKKIDSSANTVSVTSFGAETIDGLASQVLTDQYESINIESDGANWQIVSTLTPSVAPPAPPSSGMLDVKSIVKTDGDFSSLNPVPGTTISFTTTRAGVSLLTASAYASGLSSIPSNSLGINVDGTDYTLASIAMINGAGSDRNFSQGCSGSIGVTLAAGTHTAYVFVSQSGLGFNASAGSPLTLTVIFPTSSGGVVNAAALFKQETGPTGQTLAGGDPPTVIPGSTITVTLGVPQVVMILGYCTFNDPGNNRCNGILSARVVTPGPVTTDYEGTESNGGNDVNDAAAVVNRAVSLPAGTSTISLLQTPTGAQSQTQKAFLTVVYNNPIDIAQTPEAATLVVHPTAGVGNYQTIEAAISNLPAAGGLILVREGTYTPPAGGYVLTNKPIIIRGCGADNTVIDLTTTADPAFLVGFAQNYTFEDITITGNGVDGNRRMVKATAAAQIHMHRLRGTNLRQVVEVTGGVATSFHLAEITASLFNNVASWFINANATVSVRAFDCVISGASNAGGITGGPVVDLHACSIDSVNSVTVAAGSTLTSVAFIGVTGETITLGQNSRATECNFFQVTLAVSGNSTEFAACTFIGAAGQTRCMDVTATTGPNVVGCTFSGCNTDLIRINAAVLDTEISACNFKDDATATRAIDILATAGRVSIVGNSFEFFATEAIRTAGARCMVASNTGCKVVETGAANLNRYANNDGFDPSQIIGGASLIENLQTLSVGVDITADEFMRTILVDASGANRTITLPTAASAKWREYVIKKTDASANTVTVDANGAETIDGALTQVLTTQYQFIVIQSDGSTWWII